MANQLAQHIYDEFGDKFAAKLIRDIKLIISHEDDPNSVTRAVYCWWKDPDEKLTRHELAKFLGITSPSLQVAQSKGRYKFPKYYVGGRVFYKKSEVLTMIDEDSTLVPRTAKSKAKFG